MQAFSGFSKDGVAFLAELERNNRRDWFEANRQRYEAGIVEPALRFIEDLGQRLKSVAPSVLVDPRVNGSLFRIQRDVRFSKDKRPYKTHVGIRFRDAGTAVGSKCSGPLFYVQIDSKHLYLGAGIKEFDGGLPIEFRLRLAKRDAATERLCDALERLAKDGYGLEGKAARRLPAGWSADHPHSDLSRRKGLFLSVQRRLLRKVFEPAFVHHCFDYLAPLAPVFEWLRETASRSSRSARGG